jgi:hypothetical protein
MRTLTVLCAILLLSAFAFGQNIGRGFTAYWGCPYGCAPFVPLVTTPMVSLQTVSPSPVGASNATTGLNAGARNSTLETLPANTDSIYSQPVWYSGANTVPTPEVAPSGMPPAPHMMPGHMAHMEHMEHMAMMEHHGAEEGATFIAGPVENVSPMESSAAAKSARKASRTYTNQDIDRVNQNTGTVKYDGKTEKLQ